MKRISFTLLILGTICFCSFSQGNENPAQWNFTYVQKGKIVEVTATATIDESWKIYGTNIADGGPNKTEFGLTSPKGFLMVGETEEVSIPHAKYDDLFEMDVTYFTDSAVLKQKFKVIGKNNTLEGYVRYQCCDDQQCLPPTNAEFIYQLK